MLLVVWCITLLAYESVLSLKLLQHTKKAFLLQSRWLQYACTSLTATEHQIHDNQFNNYVVVHAARTYIY